MLADLYKLNPEVKGHLSSRFAGEDEVSVLYEKAKKVVQNEFFPDRGLGKLRLSKAKEAITSFSKMTGDEFRTLDLMLFYVEMGTDFTSLYGDIGESFYNSMNVMFDRVAEQCNENEEWYDQLKDRLENVLDNASDVGWGYCDDLCDSHAAIQWAWDKE